MNPILRNKFAQSSVLLFTALCGCQHSLAESIAVDRSAEKTKQISPVHEQELHEFLKDKRLLSLLEAKEVVILETHGDWVILGDKDSKKKVGEVYYTVQDRWHLKRTNERMEKNLVWGGLFGSNSDCVICSVAKE